MEPAANNQNIGQILKQYRTSIPLTLKQLAASSGVSPSYLGRIERGQRFPSAAILRKIARPLGFGESEIFALAGYLYADEIWQQAEPLQGRTYRWLSDLCDQ